MNRYGNIAYYLFMALLLAVAFGIIKIPSRVSSTIVEALPERTDFTIAKLHRDCRYEEAESESRKYIQQLNETHGPRSKETLRARGLLAVILRDQKKLVEAEQEVREIYAIQNEDLGPENDRTLQTRRHLASTLSWAKKYPEAEQELKSILAIYQHRGDATSDEYFDTMSMLGSVLRSAGKYPESEQTYRRLFAQTTQVKGAEDADTIIYQFNLALTLRDANKPKEALEAATLAYEAGRKTLGDDHRNQKHYAALWKELSEQQSRE